jgi:predicted dehydrogenase
VGILGQPVEVTPFNQQVVTGQDQLLDNMLSVLRYPHALATVKSSAQEVEGFARRHLVVCGTQGTLQIEPLDDPRVRLALTKPIGKYGTGVQTIDLPKYSRYVDDAADIARVIRGESPAQFSSTHDLAVQETVLRSCGLPLN